MTLSESILKNYHLESFYWMFFCYKQTCLVENGDVKIGMNKERMETCVYKSDKNRKKKG